MELRNLLKQGNIIGLSPMDGITDESYRLTQTQVHKPDLIFTEFVSAEGIAHGAVKLFDQLLYSPEERPIVGQLFGKDPQSFYFATVILCHLGFDGVDINMGCPAHTVTQHGSGAALIAKPELASEIINSVKSAISDYSHGIVSLNDLKLKQKTLTVIQRNLQYSQFNHDNYLVPTISVKTRVGIEKPVVDTWIPHLLGHQLDFLTLHGRTLKQGYSGLADWDLIATSSKLASESGTYFFGNGDINNLTDAHKKIKQYNLTGVLIGRASMGNPWVFTNTTPTWPEKFQTMVAHTQAFIKVFPDRRIDPLRRHYITYTHGHPRAKELRQKIVTLTTIDQLLSLEPEFTLL